MTSLSKNKIGLIIITVMLACSISLPGSIVAASTPPYSFTPAPPSPDFSISAYPPYSPVTAGLTANTTITVTPRYSFNGTILLSASAPAGWTATFTQPSLSLTTAHADYHMLYYYGRSNSSKLSISVPSTAETGRYTVKVTGTNGSLSHSVNVTINVVTPDFRITVYPPRASVTAGTNCNSTIILTSLYGFNGAISLSATAPPGWTASFTSPSLSLSTSYLNWSQLSITVPSSAEVGKYPIVVTGKSSSLTHSVNFTVNVVTPNFQIIAHPPYAPVAAGSAANSTIIVGSLYGFSGAISLSASAPAGWTATFTQPTLSLTAYRYNCSQLSVTAPSDTLPGKYIIAITATSGSLTHSVNFTVNVITPDFRIAAFSPFAPVAAGSIVNSTVSIGSLYGFSGTISLSASAPTGWKATFASPSLQLTGASTSYKYGPFNSTKLSITIPADAASGKYTITVTGTSGSLTHSANVTISIIHP